MIIIYSIYLQQLFSDFFVFTFNINFVLVYVTFFDKVISSLLCHALFTAKGQTSKLGDPHKAEMCSRYHIT